jgi:single-strand DNA-binding protein
LGKEANFRNGGEQSACRFMLAISETWKSKNGEQKEHTEWVNVAALGPVAEQMKGIPKGTLVIVQGNSATGSYEKEGETIYYFEIQAKKLGIINEMEKAKVTGLDQNEVTLIGRLGQDPITPKEGIAHFSLACNEYQRGEDIVHWINVATFNGLAENAAKYLSKGRLVYVEGRVRTRKYDKDGQTRYATGVVAHKWQALDAKKKTQEMALGSDSVSLDYPDTDIPF